MSRLDHDAVRAQAERVLGEEPYWFPLRHHSPAVARHLEAAIRERRPKVVFIEGPRECTPLVRHVVDARTRPPVALYSSYRDDDNVLGLAGIASPGPEIPARFASWYPLLAYSPEYVAMKTARAVGADVELIDLPHAALIRPAPGPAAPADDDATPARPEGPIADEQLLSESDFYQELAREAGFRNWDQAWDSLFEFSTLDREVFRAELAVFCAAARATTPAERMTRDGTYERERFMWRSVQQGLAARGLGLADALVATGGFHLFLDRGDTAAPPATPAGTVYTSVVPYSFFRVSELSGYGAGNRAPHYYQSLWELGPDGDREELLARHTVAILKRARREGEAVSSADAISIAQHARLLAALRRRQTPILDDIHDAVMSCCCKGSPEDRGRGLRRAMDAVDIGSRIGAVTPELGRLPLVDDFYAQVSALDLGEVVENEKRTTLKLDKRQEVDRRRSAFLHRLAYLEVPLARLAERGSAGALFREVWHLRWSPQVETQLTEQSLYGDTLERAALFRLREALAAHGEEAARTASLLTAALDMDLPTLADEVERACGHAIAADPRFVSLAEALRHLQLLRRRLVTDAARQAALAALLEQAYDRTCFALPEAASAPAAEQEAVVEGLRIVAETLVGDDSERLDREVLIQHVRDAAQASQVPFLRGAFLGMLAELHVVPVEETTAAVAAHARATRERMIEAGEFLDGMLAVGRTSLLLGASPLVEAVDELLEAADAEAFLIMLPRLRAAFDRLHERQRLTLADRVAQRHGIRKAESLTRLGVSVAAGAAIARIDAAVAHILAGWTL